MPAFEFGGRRFNNTIEPVLDVLGGKWQMPILWRLQGRPWPDWSPAFKTRGAPAPRPRRNRSAA